MISFCIVNWNGSEVLEKSVKSIIENLHSFEYEIIVVDNNSSDNSIQLISEFPEVKIYLNKENEMFSKATNLTVDKAKYDNIVIMNNDIIFDDEHSIVFYLNLLLNNQDDVIVPKLRNLDGTTQLSIRNVLTPKIFISEIFGNFMSGKKWIIKDFDFFKEQNVEQPLFSLLFMTKKKFYEVGYLDERFPLLFNDVDWCKRAKDKEVSLKYYPGPSILHLHGNSVNKLKMRKIIISTYSMIKYFGKHFPLQRIVLLPLFILSLFARLFREKIK